MTSFFVFISYKGSKENNTLGKNGSGAVLKRIFGGFQNSERL
jgi:hypothetical protein